MSAVLGGVVDSLDYGHDGQQSVRLAAAPFAPQYPRRPETPRDLDQRLPATPGSLSKLLNAGEALALPQGVFGRSTKEARS